MIKKITSLIISLLLVIGLASNVSAAQDAFYFHKEKEVAIKLINTALDYHQKLNHPNQITKLLSLLYTDQFEEARKHMELILDGEKETAQNILLQFVESK